METIWVPSGAKHNVRFFKFLNKADISKVMSGSLLFRHLNYYVQLELQKGDTFIGDKYEGRVLNHIRSLTVDQTSSSAMREDMSALGIQLLDGGSVHFHESTIAMNENGFIFCFSYGEYSNLLNSMNEGAGYDGCVEIRNIMDFGNRLLKHSYLDDIPVKKLFNIEVGEVQYDDLEAHVIDGNGMLRRPDPFLKQKKYAGQKEIRFVLKPFRSLPERYQSADTIFLRMDRPETALKTIDV